MALNAAKLTSDGELATDRLAQSGAGRAGRRRALIWGLRLVFLVAGLAAWQWISDSFDETFFISRPSDIWSELVTLMASGTLLRNVLVTLKEAAAGYFLGGFLAVVMGIVVGRVRLLGETFDPFVVAFFSIPKLAIAPLIILWFGIGFQSKLMLAALMTFYMTFWNTYAGVQKVSPDLINVVRVMGASRSRLMAEVIFPSSIGWILVGLRMSVPYALMGAVVGEIMAGNQGLGYLVQSAASQFNTAGVFAVLVVLCLLGTIVNQAVAWAGRRSQKWSVDA